MRTRAQEKSTDISTYTANKARLIAGADMRVTPDTAQNGEDVRELRHETMWSIASVNTSKFSSRIWLRWVLRKMTLM